jgi:predicted RNase H-like HicB family nuclease
MTTTVPSKKYEYRVGKVVKNPSEYRCHLALTTDADGQVSAVVLNLPGTGSCGESDEKAISNAREAIAGVIESYVEDKESIPWVDQFDYEIPINARQKWILVNVE